MHARQIACIAAALTVLLPPAHAAGQLLPATPDVTGARVRFGPLWMNPSIAITNVGVDTNLFNEAEEEQPKRDIAVAVTPQTDMWMRAGRTWLSGNVRQDMMWYRDYGDEGSTNGTYRFGWVVPLTRVALLVDGQWVHARERPGAEIDARARRQEGAGLAALELRMLSRTYVGGSVERRTVRFSSGAMFEGVDLREELTRVRTTGALSVRHALTPMTSVIAEASTYRDAFAFSTDRDATSMQMSGGIKFDPAALIKGSAFVGYRRYTPASPDVPEYTGPTVAAALTYTTLSSTRLSVEGTRDVEYSFDRNQPYYVQSGFGGTITQRIAGPLDVQARASYRTLAYRDRIGAGVLVSERRDQVTTFGVGMGHRLARDLRFAFNVEQQRRTSLVRQRSFQGYRFGMSLSYGV